MSDLSPQGPTPMQRYVRSPAVQVVGIVLFTYLAARDAAGRSWAWFAICLVFVAVGVVNLIAMRTGWRPPWYSKRQR